MTIVLLLSGLGLLVVPGCTHRWGRRLPPAEWARLTTGMLASGALVVEASLVVLGGPTMLRLAGLDEIANLCEHALGSLTPGGAPVGIGAALTAALLAILGTRPLLAAARARQTVRVEPGVGAHANLCGHDLVVLPTAELAAFTVGGQASQVVVSRGLVDILTDDELAAVMRHELTHLRHRHQRHLLLARVVEQTLGRVPLVRRSTATLRCALERWADEDAAAGGPAERASVHAALLRVARATATADVAAFIHPATVLERLRALEVEPADGFAAVRRIGIYLPAVALGVVALVALTGTAHEVALLRVLGDLCLPH